MKSEARFKQLHGVEKGTLAGDARFEARLSTFMLKVTYTTTL